MSLSFSLFSFIVYLFTPSQILQNLSENPNSDKYSAPSLAYNFILDKSPGRLFFLQLHKRQAVITSLSFTSNLA